MNGRAGRRRFPSAAAAVIAAAVALSGCVTASAGGARIVVAQFGNATDDPVVISLTGLRPGQDVLLTATATTPAGEWRSRALYAVPPTGAVDTASQQPITAPYVRPDAAALLWSMSGPSVSQADLKRAWAEGPVRIELTARQQGVEVATTQVQRSALAAQSVEREVSVADLARDATATGDAVPPANGPGLRVGTLYTPLPTLVHPRPAVLLIDGDDDAASGAFAARRIAAIGFPVLTLPAFGPEGQLPGSAALSVQTFDAARAWLARRPGVDPRRIVVYGTGPAAPLALWFAVAEPGAIYGAVSASGPTAELCASASGAPSLLDDGRPVPCADPARTIADTPILPLGRIPGPLLLACGTADELLPSACDWVAAGAAARGPRAAGETLVADGSAGELSAPPVIPVGLGDLPPQIAQATEDARVAFWSRVTALLEGAIGP
ncbi:acyl-CoA thioesterase/BAAT N-terminal domain-containing protein [Leifsonia shinshuensis]|uniref:acyl-CoA thioesterase/bile acid-CoA:amino acid N-acyltransferase family protein n=1 Tax=Leifsonia shinshuensis TaxID=150026 RepID=UPI001F504D63|nr:acyl-CoA thioesterase/bile acid-CoA:amino acid N-acyltransferase family protein [Leifsonia shinshuensis]MCI0157350.1 acyl-CoA thioesterase/BAAT N-terminal domain-containing protein [Leifsonia shinshuensis]